MIYSTNREKDKNNHFTEKAHHKFGKVKQSFVSFHRSCADLKQSQKTVVHH